MRAVGVPWVVVAVALAMAAAYFVAVEAILLWPSWLDPTHWTRLSSTDTLALAGSVLTAAGLSALYVQMLSTQQQEADRLASAALRFDEIHAMFNTIEMQRYRDLAWVYAKHVSANATRRRQFARWWILSKGAAPAAPVDLLEKNNLSHLGSASLADYTWAMSVMVAFFTRIENRLAAYKPKGHYDKEALQAAVGPFFWKYWEAPLIKIVDACDDVYLKEGASAPEPGYFVKPLRNLRDRFK